MYYCMIVYVVCIMYDCIIHHVLRSVYYVLAYCLLCFQGRGRSPGCGRAAPREVVEPVVLPEGGGGEFGFLFTIQYAVV